MLQAIKSKGSNFKKNSSSEMSVRFTSTKLRKTHTAKETHPRIEKVEEKPKQKHYYSKSHNYYPDGNAGNYQGL